MPGEISDCVPSYLMFQGAGTVDAEGNRSWTPSNTLLIYRYFYYGTTWWVMQDAEQLSDSVAFTEHYSVVSNMSETTPPSTGWRKTQSLAIQDADPNVKPIAVSLWPNCTAQEQEDATQLSGSLDAPKPDAKPDVKDSDGGTPTLPRTPSNSPTGTGEFRGNTAIRKSAAVRHSAVLFEVLVSLLSWGVLLFY